MEDSPRNDIMTDESPAIAPSHPSQGGWGASPLPTPSADTTSPQSTWYSDSASPDRAVSGFHRGYANTLKTVTYLFTFGVPLIILTVYIGAEGSDGLGFAFLACAFLAFVLWLTCSYITKLFNLVSKNAQLNSLILDELRQLRKEVKK